MKSMTNFIVTIICLQLTVGTYSIQNQMAYAQDDRSVSEPSRGPASENLSMSPEEVNDNAKNYIEQFQGQCVDGNGAIKENVAFMHDREIGGEEPRMYNCAAAAEVIQKIILPGMNDIQEEVENSQVDPNCPTCGIPNQDVSGDAVAEGAACSLAEQKKFAKTADKCDAWCGLASVATLGLATGSNCDASYKSAGVAASCLVDLAKGVIKGIWEVLTFIPKLIWDGVKWGWNKLFGKAESTTSEKAHALAGLSDEQIKLGKKDPKALEQSFLQKAGMFFKEFGKAVVGWPEYEEKAKCTDCGGKAALMCGVIGNAGGFMLTLFGNGLIFGATKGLGTKIATKMMKFSKGTSKFAKFTASTIKVTKTTGKIVAKPFIGFGNIIVKGASKLSKGAIKWWSKFKGSKTYAALAKFKNTGVYKKVFAANSIPGKISLKIGRGVSNGFKKMGAFEDRMFMKGVKLTNKELHSKMLRAQKINALRYAKLDEEAKIKNVKKTDVAAEEQTSAAATETLHGVDELKVVKDASHGRTVEQWADLKKKASNELSGVKVKNLDDIENAVPVDFTINAGKEKSILVETSKGTKEVKLSNPADVESIHTYQDAKYAVVQNKDGSYIIHDMESGSHLTQVKKDKSEFVDALLGKKTKSFDDLEGMSYDQVKTNLKINGTKYVEEVDAAGVKTLKIETPKGCNPKTLTFGVDKAI